GRAPDSRDELVSSRGATLRRVRLQLSLRAAPRDRTPADGPGLQHESRAPLAGYPDGVRVARRRRRAHRGHDLPDVPRSPPPRAPARHGADSSGLDVDAPRRDGSARAVLRRRLFLAPNRLPLGAGHARSARPSFGLRLLVPGRARPVRLPPALTPGQRLVLAQVRSRRAAAV